MQVYHLIVGAKGRSRLVVDDRDRYALLEAMHVQLKRAVLAYCVMATHLHLIAEGVQEHLLRWLGSALHAFAYERNRRHAEEDELLRGPPVAIEVPGAEEIARAIAYVHWNPVKASPPLVARPVDYRWSSQAAFMRLSCARLVNVARASELMGEHAWRISAGAPPLEDSAPVRVPAASPDTILAAAARALEVDPAAVRTRGMAPELIAARALYVRVGLLEGYDHDQLGPALRRTRSPVTRLASEEVPDADVRIARTLLRDPRLRRRLPGARPPEMEIAP